MCSSDLDILLGKEKMSTQAPEYWGIDCGIQYAERRYGAEVADHCLDLALKMGKRKPKTFAQLKALSGYDDEHLTLVLEALCQVLHPIWGAQRAPMASPGHLPATPAKPLANHPPYQTSPSYHSPPITSFLFHL